MEHLFATRFGYLCWRYFLQTGEAPGFAEIGRAIGRTGPAVGGWMKAVNAPTDYRIHAPLAEFFELEDARWIIGDEGEPPDPDLWKIWLRYRRVQPKAAPKGAAKRITRADVAAAKTAAKRKGA